MRATVAALIAAALAFACGHPAVESTDITDSSGILDANGTDAASDVAGVDTADAATEVQSAEIADESADVPADEPADAAADIADIADVLFDTALSDVQEQDVGNPAGNLKLHLTTSTLGLSGKLMVIAVDSEELASGQFGGAGDSQLFFSDLPALPIDLYLTVPQGKWAILAVLLGPDGKPGNIGGMLCAGGAVQVLTFAPDQPPLQVAAIEIQQITANSASMMCGGPKPLLTPMFDADPPATKYGKGHYLQTIVWDDHQWIADSHDGFLRFDMAQAMPPLQNWLVYGDPHCSRFTRNNNDLWCADRSSWVQHLTVKAGTQEKLAVNKIDLKEIIQVEGMTAQNDTLWLAAHKAGLRALKLSTPYDKIPLQLPSDLGDVWDVRAIGQERLVLARGVGGLVVLNVSADNAISPKVTATLPLPGLAVFLQISGNWALVGALSDGMHLIDLTNPDKPLLRGTLKVPDPVHYSTIVGDLVLVAAGDHIYALDLPKPGAATPLVTRAVLPSTRFAMDLAPIGADVVTAEFEMVRRLHVDPTAISDVPLVLPRVVQVPLAKVGAALKTTLRLDNVGSKSIVIKDIRWIEGSGAPVALVKGQVLLAGTGASFTLAPVKTMQGVLKHKLLVYVENMADPLIVPFNEVTTLQPGDVLPPLQYQDAKGKNWDVQQAISGKVGVVLVAAESCPIGFLAMAAMSTDLAPQLANNTVMAFAINPWDLPKIAEAQILSLNCPVLYTPLTTKDGHDYSEILDVTLGQPNLAGAPMPLVYVIGKNGKIVLAQQGWNAAVTRAIDEAQKVF